MRNYNTKCQYCNCNEYDAYHNLKRICGNCYNDFVGVRLKELKKEKELGRMNEIKCCQECEINGLERYLESKSFSKRNHLIKNVISEDCQVCECKMEHEKPEVKEELKVKHICRKCVNRMLYPVNSKNTIIVDEAICQYEFHKQWWYKEEKVEFVDKSKTKEEKDCWSLVYKLKDMENFVSQINLSKDDCEIIYGNLSDIVYWKMELMK